MATIFGALVRFRVLVTPAATTDPTMELVISAPMSLAPSELNFRFLNILPPPVASLTARPTPVVTRPFQFSQMNQLGRDFLVNIVKPGEVANQEMMLTMIAYSLDNPFLTPGAFIEIDGAFAMDSALAPKVQTVSLSDTLVSIEDWKKLAHRKAGGKITFVVVNPDGGKPHEIYL
jgi:hypothetical protein